MKLAEQEAKIGKEMEKKQRKARKRAINDRQLEIQNDTLDAAGYPQATMLKASEILAELRSKGKSKNRPDSDFDHEQLKMGTAVEMEHGLGKDAAKEIAKDHLVEMPDYYTRLKKMEAKKSLERKLVVLVKSKYLFRKKVNGKWRYVYETPRKPNQQPWKGKKEGALKEGNEFDIVVWGKPSRVKILQVRNESPRPSGFNPDRTPKEYVTQITDKETGKVIEKKFTMGASEIKTGIKNYEKDLARGSRAKG
jgi:hypothetical protein